MFLERENSKTCWRTNHFLRHRSYFAKQHPLIPILHPGRYMQSFYSAPHRRPPMCLQYAVWTMGTLANEKYAHYHDAFHRRCRHYLEEDELKVRKDRRQILQVWHAIRAASYPCHDVDFLLLRFQDTLPPVLPLTVAHIGRRRTLSDCGPRTSLGTDGNYRGTQYVVH